MIAEIVDLYLTERRQRGELTDSSVKTCRSVLLRFAGMVEALERDEVNRWWNGLVGSATHARNSLSVVRTFCRWCVENGYIASDPTSHIVPPPQHRTVPQTLAPEAIGLLVKTCKTWEGAAILLLMAHCGFRCVELSRLRVTDIDRDEQMIFVRGKGGHERLIPVPTEAWNALVRYLTIVSGPLVFPHSPSVLSQMVGKWVRRAGLKRHAYDGIAAHGLRRTCATDLLEGGAHIRQVQQVLGHSQLSSTERYLRRFDAKDLRRVMGGRSYMGSVE